MSDQMQRITANRKAQEASHPSFAEDYGKFDRILHYDDTNTVELFKKKVLLSDPPSPAKPPQIHILGVLRRHSANTIKELYAIKVFHHTHNPLSQDNLPSRTINLSHPNIIPIIDILYNKQRNLCLIMPYYAGGDLLSFLWRSWKPNQEPSTEELDCLAIQILRGVAFLHENNIAHGDLRPEHILLTARGSAKVGGFGQDEDAIRELATLADSGNLTSSSEPNPDTPPGSESKPILCIRRTVSDASVPYLPPERFPGQGSRPETYAQQDCCGFRAGDMWACGIICVLLRSGELPWPSAQRVNPDNESYAVYLHCRLKKDGYALIQPLQEHYRNLVYAMLHPDIEARITAEEALRSEWALEVPACEIGEKGL
ncbi:kinase-like domain-containing protein [Penicillium robsamsonii]|uniref:kinase-like domain-containing protein n=1 Tax=Penicillium robsamsonii TaxID=1792511 RepID=UPI002546956B|nr:kinase-like domain-containing protein [Penicillium robsamsonii]KAJ5835863.1 kinase-like domain-containing protein [Penicillium robsamsonii]